MQTGSVYSATCSATASACSLVVTAFRLLCWLLTRKDTILEPGGTNHTCKCPADCPRPINQAHRQEPAARAPVKHPTKRSCCITFVVGRFFARNSITALTSTSGCLDAMVSNPVASTPSNNGAHRQAGATRASVQRAMSCGGKKSVMIR